MIINLLRANIPSGIESFHLRSFHLTRIAWFGATSTCCNSLLYNSPWKCMRDLLLLHVSSVYTLFATILRSLAAPTALANWLVNDDLYHSDQATRLCTYSDSNMHSKSCLLLATASQGSDVLEDSLCATRSLAAHALMGKLLKEHGKEKASLRYHWSLAVHQLPGPHDNVVKASRSALYASALGSHSCHKCDSTMTTKVL